MSKTVAQLLIDQLIDAGVKRIYGIVGDSLNPISNVLRNEKRIEFIHVRHEEAGAFAASAEAQLSGNLVVCAGSSGPGHVHLLNGLYDAQRSYAPVLAIASTLPSFEMGTGYFQETHPEQLFKDCSGFCETISNPAQLPRVLQIAMQTAVTRRCVSVIALPGDVAAKEVDDLSLLHSVFTVPPRLRPSEEDILRLAKEINAADRVTIFGGDGCRDAHTQLIALAERLKAPVGHSLRGKQWVAADNPYDVGMTGLLGFGGLTQAMRESDLVLLLGTDFPYEIWYPTRPRIIQIDNRGENIGRRARVDWGLVGDIGETIRALLPHLTQKEKPDHLGRALVHTKAVLEKLHNYVDSIGKGEKLHPEYASALIDKYAHKDAVFTVDTGMTTVWGARYITAMKDRRIIGSFTHGSMACALPMGIGAQLLYPQREVVVMAGDGGMTMLMGDLLTVAQYDLPLKMFVYNNGALAFINLEMLAAGYGGGFKTSLKNPNFAAMAEAIGIQGVRIETNEEADELVHSAMEAKGPVLIDLVTDVNAVVVPPAVSLAMATNFSLGLSKLALLGNFDDTLSIIKSSVKAM